ncbi:MAG: hypothetical protein U9R27_02400 [Campylobacterota bacterium]|nr:hypothetical protein [Campylobacterota bacterium]
MAIYYYAYSGHKYGLDRVKRGVALIKAMQAQGVEVNLLLNDFRAGLAAKELGAVDSVTIETILDIDVIAEKGDTLFIDSPEDDRGKLEKYSSEYKPLFRVVDSSDEIASYGEVLMKPYCKDGLESLSSIIVDRDYFTAGTKEERVLFFFGDADYDKVILSNAEFFEGMEMDLLLGQYFFVKYEDDLAQIFERLHEPEEYRDLICSSSRVVTSSLQTALDARAAEADVIYIKKPADAESLLHQLERFGIKIIEGFDREELIKALDAQKDVKKVPNDIDITAKNIIDSIFL